MTEPAREVREITSTAEWLWICSACGTEFRTSRSGRRRFCSLACSASHLANEWWEKDREGMRQKIAVRNAARQASLTQRFHAGFKVDASGCWFWQKAKDRAGYGKLSAGTSGSSGLVKAHRVAYALFVGPIPPGLLVCHRCDIPACVNPSHLFLGTNADNRNDSMRKGRQKSPAARLGADNPNARLAQAQVDVIRQSAERSSVLAQRYGVTRNNIWLIRKGLTWNAK